jgi:hypothetical protein
VGVDQQHAVMDALDFGVSHRTRLREARTNHDKKKAQRSHALNIAHALSSRCNAMNPSEEFSARREALLSAIGLWKDRTDLPNSERYVRELRQGDRLDRLSEKED